ncbi:hypothetical protein X797_003041 [Metarhizium robertsii]|uniref:Uncharacterized protein n=1 Tax=Metarhizium robertsii TaxID=568076 RepID=A0A0A1UYX0_9HYPO|nr:hypothetical protein X797_003041 [Metarhizium robertsii]
MQFGPMNSVMAVSPCRLWYEPLLKSFPNQRCICLSPALFLRGLFERCGYSFRPDLLEIEKERSVGGEEGSVDARISQPYPHVKRRRRRRHYAPDLELDGPPRPALGAVIRRMGIRPLYITRTNGSMCGSNSGGRMQTARVATWPAWKSYTANEPRAQVGYSAIL